MWVAAGLSALLLLCRRRLLTGPRAAARVTVAAVLVAGFAASMAQTIVVVALPEIAREFGVAGTTAPWALTAFMLAAAVATPVAGRLGDLFGYRRIALACLGCLVAGTLVCALAPSFALLLAGRALAGLSAGVLPLAFGLLRRAAPAGRLPGLVGLLSAMFGIGGAAGMVTAGPLLTSAGPSALFWPLLALGIVALVLVALLPSDEAAAGGRVDVAGAVLLGGALAGLLLAVGRARDWGAVAAAGLLTLTVALFAAFAVVERRAPAPLVDLRLLARPAAAVPNVVTVVIGASMFGVVTLLPHLVTVERIAVVLLPMVAAMLVATPLAPWLGGRRALRAGTVLGAVSAGVLALAHDELWQLCLVAPVLGAGYGLAFAALGTLVVDAAEPRHTGVATAVNTIARTAGGAIGAQLAAVLVAGGGFGPAFAAFGVVAAVALAVTVALPRPVAEPALSRSGR
ncbi:MFS transporter [Jiangella anatolica]|uniref:MFS transporter n=1 Tax=Jiangella anatolica TaxID=2670374 RepID=A0A2W2BW26_9ACTN|nr:MFS transporter [Jiangella anatolica]PZF84624.1 MFS transporter [Jiangella anatolica]